MGDVEEEGRGPGPTLALLPLFKPPARWWWWPESRCVGRKPPAGVGGQFIVLLGLVEETMELRLAVLSLRSRGGDATSVGGGMADEDGFDPSALIIVVC